MRFQAVQNGHVQRDQAEDKGQRDPDDGEDLNADAIGLTDSRFLHVTPPSPRSEFSYSER